MLAADEFSLPFSSPQAPGQLYFQDDGATPNSPLPVLIYELQWHAGLDRAAALEALFARHGWVPLWRDGIFDYHHYHPNAHEALGVVSGQARVTLGGEQGKTLVLKEGQVVILPAGVGHCCVDSSSDFLVIGAYPKGQEGYDIERPSPRSRDAALARIAQVALPGADPVTGQQGTLMETWRQAKPQESRR
ncbi:cupin domain-containing protein [Pseudomonas capeferrum]|uniref:cupin domain-containing protein n=1 Tax=Pseudomonas capeferrum TaxID=1495066 RepID=UPI0015E300A1|nr:cupin domain-containing protein [Pseudomonas capeferrum]MBA1202722.1 cupin domain-containing protein [Pseudomonas capeferrum]